MIESKIVTEIVGDVLAKKTDSRGFTIVLTSYVEEQLYGRKGTHWIISPTGEIVRAGYWMDSPEPDVDSENYWAMSVTERAEHDCQCEIDRYDGLACNFEHHRFGAWLPEDTFEERLRTRFFEVWEMYPRLTKRSVFDVFFKWSIPSFFDKKDFLRTLPKELAVKNEA